ncbi:disulfide bond formation protein B (plasmid) [Priestia endophytica]|uniref:disulfide oxidoreductase n=1 Tax=Priestia endophytica TaxID=135735 RepID=UPI000DCA467F|nr:disulfide oxidoreductase [Priestia endophytica]RAS90834.1 disulfide bond formation protein B [Priestia endophytica]
MNNNKLKDNFFFISWILSLVSILGSLYFSEVLKYEPCELCWYERIFMYPLLFILGLAIIKKDFCQSRYVLVLCSIGSIISLYHYAFQKGIIGKYVVFACGRVSCMEGYINWLGFITIPLLSFVAFLAITIMMIVIIKIEKKDLRNEKNIN